VGAIDRGEES